MSGPGDRIASTRDVAIYLREDCRSLRDSLQFEMVVAQYCLRIRDLLNTRGVRVGDAVGVGVVAELEGNGDALSHAILRGLADLAGGDMATASGEAAARLAERGLTLPDQFVDVGKARATGAWRTDTGGFPGEYVLFAEFEHAPGPRHAIAMYVEPRRGGLVKHLGLIGPVSDFGPHEPFHPHAMEPLDIADGGALMRDLLERSYGALAAESDDFRVLIARARAHSMIPRH